MDKNKSPFIGLLVAIFIITSWLGLLIVLLTQPTMPMFLALPLMLLQTFLFTGLFITAHDAMHGTLAPEYPKLNHGLGRISVLLYALFSYSKLKLKHGFHHKYPGTEKDPDFHEPGKPQVINWYFRFIRNYLSLQQIIGMALIFNILLHLFNIQWLNLILFWVIPSLLSTIQLFYFGTYLPHRKTDIGFPDNHRANSMQYPKWISFITCFHFGGFHWEHHLFPGTPWWLLPQRKK